MDNTPVYITGHRNPDTDSIVSAIAYSFFKKTQGIRALPCRLGKLNAESRYLLERFHYPEPRLLTDARVTLAEISMDPPVCLHPDATIFECLQQMQSGNRTYCGIVDDSMHLIGLVTKSDISVIGLYDTARAVSIMAETPVENFAKTLDGQIVYADPAMKINGHISIIAMTKQEKLDRYEVSGRIVICGDDAETQKQMIMKGAGMLVAVWCRQIEPSVIELAKQHRCSILISGHGGMNTMRYIYFAPSVSSIMTKNMIRFHDQDLAEDAGRTMLQTRHHIYPVTDRDGKLTGYISRFHIMQAANRQLILVDHNEFSQSVHAIEKAQVLEVIDHHRIHDFSSAYPVQFRNETVGSTATIIATIFRENQIPIPAALAGLMLGAILSDTLNFHSPTSTDRDRACANILAAIADLDVDDFAREMFAASAESRDLSPAELLRLDMKVYDIASVKLSVSQVILPDLGQMSAYRADIQTALEELAAKQGLELSVLALTSILENGSVLYFGGPKAARGREAFEEEDVRRLRFHAGLLSRKLQIIPKLNEAAARYL